MTTDNPLYGYESHVPSFIRSFNRIICIGDSLTEGSCNYDGGGTIAFKDYSYPTILSKMTGVDVLNYGISGDCASTSQHVCDLQRCYLERAKKRGFFLDFKADAFLVALGTNDISKEGSFTGDVSTDIDMADSSKNARNSVGGYASLLSLIRHHNPKSFIFCVTLPNTRNDHDSRLEANEKIRAIAKLFGAYVIDMERYAEQEGPELEAFRKVFMNVSHNNALGYNVRARQYCTYIDHIIETHLEAFRNLQFTGCEYTCSL
ncbi:MAG: SGNH/GDSL hydrolase family protein [Sphaerochaetaceae bacterium]|nr:SGNH/GDSL hydrolase family protein [Sphaerochaetaceae bacterium]